MNWLDLVIIAMIVIGTIIGMKIGLLGAAITAAGALIGWLLAAQFSDDITQWFGRDFSNSSWAHFVFYAIIIASALFVAGIVKEIVLPVLAVGTLGLSNLLDELGGLVMGLVFGIVISSALIIVMAGFAYNTYLLDEKIPGGIAERFTEDQESREEAEAALVGSAAVPVFIEVRQALPEDTLVFIPSELEKSLDILDQNIEKRQHAYGGKWALAFGEIMFDESVPAIYPR
jgi:uncharacterized membrane protein required for colicin V production